MKSNLDKLEKAIETNSAKFKPVSVKKEKRIDTIIESSKKSKNINIRINEFDLTKIQEKSAHYGLPYQTFIASILHQYITNQLLEEKAILRAIKLMKS